VSTTSPNTLETRSFDGATIPEPGVFTIDASHSSVGFVVRHLVVGKTRGRFPTFDGAVTIAAEPLESSVEVTVDLASVDTHDEARDAHLRSGDFFDVEQYPTMTFRSTAVHPKGPGRYDVDGDLTIRGLTKPVTLDIELEGLALDPWGGERVAFTARGEIDREEWGLTWNAALETGGVVVGKRVKLEIEAEAVRSA
jgi:polyisoprenoid-binding protein YceI